MAKSGHTQSANLLISSQFVTIAADGTSMFWDIRIPGSDKLDFAQLDLTWRPFFKVGLCMHFALLHSIDFPIRSFLPVLSTAVTMMVFEFQSIIQRAGFINPKVIQQRKKRGTMFTPSQVHIAIKAVILIYTRRSSLAPR